MFPNLIPVPEWPENGFSGRIRASFRTNLNLSDHCLTVIRRVSLNSVLLLEPRSLFLCTTATVITFVLTLVAWHFYSKKKNKMRARGSTTFVSLVGMSSKESSGPDEALLTLTSLKNDATFSKVMIGSEASDARFAEELQVQEALLASLSTSQRVHNASMSLQGRSMLKMGKTKKEADGPSESFCEICLENKEIWQMFRNESCSHSFCYDCMSKHIVAKLQESITKVTCPGVNCNAALDANACRFMLPEDVRVRWDESLCQSLIMESQKFYCPFRDCSTMLVNDSEEIVREVKCPVCQRSFCALCCVPWHSEFTCKEYQKLCAKKEKADGMVKFLAKKKSWQRCPCCKMYVEKTEGCIHITCRCGYEFCYRCGLKWSGSHVSCCPRS